MKKKMPYCLLTVTLLNTLALTADTDLFFNPKNWCVDSSQEYKHYNVMKQVEVKGLSNYATKTRSGTGQYVAIYQVYLPSEQKNATITVVDEYQLDNRGNASKMIKSSEKLVYSLKDSPLNPKNWSVGQTYTFDHDQTSKEIEIRSIKNYSSKISPDIEEYRTVYYGYDPKQERRATVTITESYQLDNEGNPLSPIDYSEKFAYQEETMIKRAIGYINYWTQKILGPGTPQ